MAAEHRAPDDRPRPGPFLRRYDREPPKSWRERATPILIGGGAAVGFLGILLLVVLAFLRYPLATFGVLAAVWVVGFILSQILRRRSRSRP